MKTVADFPEVFGRIVTAVEGPDSDGCYSVTMHDCGHELCFVVEVKRGELHHCSKCFEAWRATRALKLREPGKV